MKIATEINQKVNLTRESFQIFTVITFVVEALRKSYRDRGAMYDILSNILSMPDVWTLELAVEAAQVASLLAQSTEEHHQKLSSAALKYILTSYRQTIENSLNAPVSF